MPQSEELKVCVLPIVIIKHCTFVSGVSQSLAKKKFRICPYLHRCSNGNSAGCCYLKWLPPNSAAHCHSVLKQQVQEMQLLHFLHYCYVLILHLPYLQWTLSALLLRRELQHLDFYCWHPIHMV